MPNTKPFRIKSITEFHRLRSLPAPDHPLISVVNYADIQLTAEESGNNVLFDFYSISVKRGVNGKIKYGQQQYDFDEGVMFFIAPNQVFGISTEPGTAVQHSGWIVLVHPDFFWNTPLANAIKQYEYFNYSVNEALFLSEKEEIILNGIVQNIRHECRSNVDKFSQDIIIAQLELLLTYADRFYHRQFITRKITNHKVLGRLEALLAQYFNNDELTRNGLPTVQWVAENLNLSPTYLSGLLKVLTGQNTQQHIHNKLIEKAKEKLSTTSLTVSEIAYELGFEHPQSFSKLFKTKTDLSPLQFRQSFN